MQNLVLIGQVISEDIMKIWNVNEDDNDRQDGQWMMMYTKWWLKWSFG